MTARQLVREMDRAFLGMALGDIKRAARPGKPTGAKMAGFLLGFCFIDAVAGFHAGRTRQTQGTLGKDFRGFIEKYMTAYSPHALWIDLRGGLVHSYAVGNTYAFTDREQEGKHMETKQTGFGERTLLNLEDFLADIEDAYRALCRDVLANRAQFDKARERYDSLGLLTVK
jgi:hypothetical protein